MGRAHQTWCIDAKSVRGQGLNEITGNMRRAPPLTVIRVIQGDPHGNQ